MTNLKTHTKELETIRIIPTVLLLCLVVFKPEISYSQTLEAGAGANCHAIVPRQAELMEWRWYGLVNRDPNRPLWMICPASNPESILGPSIGSFYRGLYVSSAVSGEKVTCMLRYLDSATETVVSVSRSATTEFVINPVYSGLRYEAGMDWEIDNPGPVGFPAGMMVSISCQMPSDSAIVLVLETP